jgi:hypothetical protein
LPAFEHLSLEEYQQKVEAEIQRIEEEYEHKRAGNPVAGVEKILSLNPFERPTRKLPKSNPRPLLHVHKRSTREILRDEFKSFLKHYWEAAESFRLSEDCRKICNLFPAGCYPPALPFTGDAPPPRPPSPPTRLLAMEDRKIVGRRPIPVVVIPGIWSSPRSHGHPN